MASADKQSENIEHIDPHDVRMSGRSPHDVAPGGGDHGSPPSSLSKEEEAAGPVLHGSSHVVAENPSIPRKIRNKNHASQEPAAEGHAKSKAGRETEHRQVARTPVAEALAPMEAVAGRLASKAELKAHMQEVEAAHHHDSRYTAKLWHNDPATKLAGYTKSMRNMVGDDRRAHYGVSQSRRTQS